MHKMNRNNQLFYCIIAKTDINHLEGPRDLGKYKISSDFWENGPLVWDLDFVKDVSNIEISNQEPKETKCFFFFASVPWFSFLLEIFSTLLTLHCLKCLLYMNSHINQVVNVTSVRKVSRWNAISEISPKKALDFLLVQVGDFNISGIFYKIQILN